MFLRGVKWFVLVLLCVRCVLLAGLKMWRCFVLPFSVPALWC